MPSILRNILSFSRLIPCLLNRSPCTYIVMRKWYNCVLWYFYIIHRPTAKSYRLYIDQKQKQKRTNEMSVFQTTSWFWLFALNLVFKSTKIATAPVSFILITKDLEALAQTDVFFCSGRLFLKQPAFKCCLMVRWCFYSPTIHIAETYYTNHRIRLELHLFNVNEI